MWKWEVFYQWYAESIPFLALNPSISIKFRRTIFDKKLGKDVVLNEEQLRTIQRIQQGFFPETTFDPYEPYIDHFTHEKMIHPVTRRPAHKRSFIPSLTEKNQVFMINVFMY